MSQQHNKKRKQDVSSQSSEFNLPSESDDIDSILFREMTLVNSQLISLASVLSLHNAGVDTFQILSNCTSLENLTKLNLANNNLGIQSVKHLKKCSMKNLTKLNLSNLKKFTEKEAKELLTSSFMKGVKKLNLSSEKFTKGFFENISGSKNLVQLTHLELKQSCQTENNDYGLASFLQDKVNLEHLNLGNHRISIYPNLLTGGQFVNLTFLDIGLCKMPNSELANIILSPNLPKLRTLLARSFNWGNTDTNENIQIPPNSFTNSLTELDLRDTFLIPIASISYHCPQLKVLKLSNPSSENYPDKDALKKAYVTFLSAPTLSNLEELDISDLTCLESLFEIIFTSPFYSNLQKLICHCINVRNMNLEANLISNCTNLVNLRNMDGHNVIKNADCLNALKTNPTFTKLRTDLFY